MAEDSGLKQGLEIARASGLEQGQAVCSGLEEGQASVVHGSKTV